MIQRWIYKGELDDPFDEFFVAYNLVGDDDNLWRSKYSMRQDMIPTFISKVLAKKIFLIGKSLNFIRHSCEDLKYTGVENGLPQLVYGDLKMMEDSIHNVYKESSARLSSLLFEKYKLRDHLKSVKRFLLLGQGDFVQNLMDTLGDTLSKPAGTIYRHNLTATLESALRSCTQDSWVFDRLDVRLLEASHGDTGWDVFTLDYHVEAPINTILTPQTMQAYQKLFSFLWRIKRTEHALASSWRRQATNPDLFGLPLFRSVFHRSHLLAAEMMHFVNQLQHYILFEGIEGAWEELELFMSNSCDLDQLIGAHNKYINRITLNTLLVSSNQTDITRQLLKLFEAVFKFDLIQIDIYDKATAFQKRVQVTQTTVDKYADLLETCATEFQVLFA
jgi:gamma-tubulin complex component 3